MPMSDDLWKTFQKNVKKKGDCELWAGPGFGPHGYGLFKEERILAHRAAFAHHAEYVPDGLIRQSCGNKRCVRFEHLIVED